MLTPESVADLPPPCVHGCSGKRIPVTQPVDRGAVYLAQPQEPARGCC